MQAHQAPSFSGLQQPPTSKDQDRIGTPREVEVEVALETESRTGVPSRKPAGAPFRPSWPLGRLRCRRTKLRVFRACSSRRPTRLFRRLGVLAAALVAVAGSTPTSKDQDRIGTPREVEVLAARTAQMQAHQAPSFSGLQQQAPDAPVPPRQEPRKTRSLVRLHLSRPSGQEGRNGAPAG
jgi:hypothetical protein